jgi:hypothetical protein
VALLHEVKYLDGEGDFGPWLLAVYLKGRKDGRKERKEGKEGRKEERGATKGKEGERRKEGRKEG